MWTAGMPIPSRIMERQRHGPVPFADLVARTRGLQPWRRVFHACSGLVLALAPGLLDLPHGVTVGLLVLGTVLLFAFDLLRLRVAALNRLFFVAFSRLASPREAGAVASSTWYALGATVVWAVAPGTPATAALLVLGLADPAASVVGRVWGRTPLGKGTRAGTAAFFAVAFAVLWSLVGWPAALAVAAVATVSEVLPLGLDDNLTIPLATGLSLWLLAGTPLP